MFRNMRGEDRPVTLAQLGEEYLAACIDFLACYTYASCSSENKRCGMHWVTAVWFVCHMVYAIPGRVCITLHVHEVRERSKEKRRWFHESLILIYLMKISKTVCLLETGWRKWR